MKFFFLSAHNKPSGGTKVINQIVNLCREKGYKSYLVTIEDKPKKKIGYTVKEKQARYDSKLKKKKK